MESHRRRRKNLEGRKPPGVSSGREEGKQTGREGRREGGARAAAAAMKKYAFIIFLNFVIYHRGRGARVGELRRRQQSGWFGTAAVGRRSRFGEGRCLDDVASASAQRTHQVDEGWLWSRM